MRARFALLACVCMPFAGLVSDAASAVRANSRESTARQGRATPQGIATGPLRTGIVDVPPFLAPDAAINFAHVRSAGSTVVRLTIFWKYIGLTGEQRPPNFHPDDPADPNYQWGSFDREVVLAARDGLMPIVCIALAPPWAERGPASIGNAGTRNPNPADLADFARAAARRYSGDFRGLPRVRYWQVWNEPNFSGFLNPTSPDLYREMVNAFAAAVHGVHPDNLVVAGGESPFGFPKVAAPPLTFMRELLCMSAGSNPKPTCSAKLDFDVWSHHPYTTGGPFHHAQNPGDVSLGDLPEMRRVLTAAIKAGHVVSRHRIQFWVTEFSWDTNPPDPVAVPTGLQAHWVAEALYQMWRSGVSLVTWFQIRDEPLSQSEFQSGLFSISGPSAATDRPKLAFSAFRFPFVALVRGAGIDIWGRTPWGRPGNVVVERQTGRSWARVATLASDQYGIFRSRLRGVPKGPLRARLAGKRDASLPFSLVEPPDRYYWPFGCGGILPCS